MGAKQTFRYALNFQQLQDRWKAGRYRLSETRQRKPVQTLRKVDRQSKTLQNLQQHWSRASRYRLKVCTKQTQSQSRGSGFAPRIAVRSAKKRFWYVYFATQSTILALEKSTTRPPAMESRNEAAPLPRGRKTIPFPREREKHVPFVL